jgi:hypothetical protein
MKTISRKILSLFLLLAMLFSMTQLVSVPASADANTDFTVVNGVLTRYNGSKDRVAIPSTVTSIGELAFNECTDILEIAIPSSVTSIGRYAFEECSGLTKITIPDSVTAIGNYAFDQCTSLKSAVISNNVKSIGVRTFNECSNLTKITVPDSVTSIGNYAFADCTSLTSATISGSVKSIGLGAFDDCDKVTISGYTNTAIQTYASKNDITFKSLGTGTFTLDTKSYVIAPKNSYTIGAKLVGTSLTVKAYSSNSTVAKVTKVSGTEYKVTALKVGTTYIMFDIYDKTGKKLGHASVKITAKRGTASSGNSSKQVVKF